MTSGSPAWGRSIGRAGNPSSSTFDPVSLSGYAGAYLGGGDMGKAAKQSDLVSFKELLLANSIQIDTLTQLLIEAGVITEERFFTTLKEVQLQYRNRGNV
jgi:hypothetical protein